MSKRLTVSDELYKKVNTIKGMFGIKTIGEALAFIVKNQHKEEVVVKILSTLIKDGLKGRQCVEKAYLLNTLEVQVKKEVHIPSVYYEAYKKITRNK